MKRLAACLLASSLLVATTAATADIPPPDICGKAGDACKNAGPKYDQPGVCTATKCSKAIHGPEGVKPYEYDCNLCVATGAGATAPTAALTDGGAPAAASADPGAPVKRGCSCSVPGLADTGIGGTLGIGAALGALALLRRKRATG